MKTDSNPAAVQKEGGVFEVPGTAQNRADNDGQVFRKSGRQAAKGFL